jgi:hypothetical protein
MPEEAHALLAMPERASALLALWNDVVPEEVDAYEDWHAHEHVPERCTVPGILWGRRFARVTSAATRPMPHFLTLYGLRDAQVLDSAPYQRLLREPTPMSRRMRPALRNVSRWVCRLHENTADATATRFVVWTLDDPPRDDQRTPPGTAGALGHLLAERIPDATPLPWLGADQGLGVEGRWLMGVALREGATIEVTSPHTGYRRLPVGNAENGVI